VIESGSLCDVTMSRLIAAIVSQAPPYDDALRVWRILLEKQSPPKHCASACLKRAGDYHLDPGFRRVRSRALVREAKRSTRRERRRESYGHYLLRLRWWGQFLG